MAVVSPLLIVYNYYILLNRSCSAVFLLQRCHIELTGLGSDIVVLSESELD